MLVLKILNAICHQSCGFLTTTAWRNSLYIIPTDTQGSAPQPVCHFVVSGVPLRGVRCAASWYQVCHFVISGVPLRDIRCATSWCQVCHFVVSGVPLRGVRCAANFY
jgi:hypothetical protein